MKRSLNAMVLGLGLIMAPWLSGAENTVIAPGAKVEKRVGGFQFTEGPTCDAEGNVFFTDQPNDRSLKWSVEGRLSTFLQPAGRAHGMYFDPEGNLIACADATNALWSIEPDVIVECTSVGSGGRSAPYPRRVSRPRWCCGTTPASAA